MNLVITPRVSALLEVYQSRQLEPAPPVLPPAPTLKPDEAWVEGFVALCLHAKTYWSSQRYGPAIEKALITSFNGVPVPQRDDRGDAQFAGYGFTEIKVSITDKGNWSVQQIRPWQATDHYLLALCDINGGDPRLLVAMAPSSLITMMGDEIGCCSHKTAASNQGDARTEVGVQLRASSVWTSRLFDYALVRINIG